MTGRVGISKNEAQRGALPRCRHFPAEAQSPDAPASAVSWRGVQLSIPAASSASPSPLPVCNQVELESRVDSGAHWPASFVADSRPRRGGRRADLHQAVVRSPDTPRSELTRTNLQLEPGHGRRRRARNLAASAVTTAPVFQTPQSQAMKILPAVDGSPTSARAVAHAVKLMRQLPAAQLTLLHADPPLLQAAVTKIGAEAATRCHLENGRYATRSAHASRTTRRWWSAIPPPASCARRRKVAMT